MKQILKAIIIPALRKIGQTQNFSIDWKDVGDLDAASALLDTMRAARYLNPAVVDAPSQKKVLVVAPHPDDEIIGCGGALLEMIRKGCEVKVVYLTTDGSDIEKQEIQQVAEDVGFSTEFLDFPMRSISLKKQDLLPLQQVFEIFQPDILFLPFVLDDHPDHRDASYALLKICQDIEPLNAIEVWCYQVYTSLPLNAVLNIGGVMQEKIRILNLYQSRFKPRDWAHYVSGLNAWNTRFLMHPDKSDYAEVFFRSSLKTYLNLCFSYRNSVRS